MLKQINNHLNKSNKKALSVIVSYVLVISIGITIALISYSFIKNYPNILNEKEDCKDGTSLILESAVFDAENDKLIVNVKNNGLFNINGFLISVGDDENKAPEINDLKSIPEQPATKGAYNFLPVLNPGDSKEITFDTEDYDIKVINIQPFINKDNKRIICSESLIRYEL